MKPTVFAVRCETYDQVEDKTQKLLEMMGGIQPYITAGETTALKVNLLSAAAPQKAVTTHPSLVAAVGQKVREAGGEPLIIDSPSGAYAHKRSALEKVYQAAEMDRAAAQARLALNYNTDWQALSFPEGRLIKHFEIMTPILEAGSVINLPKLKTHALMTMTGAVKNMFGAIPGRTKPGYHAKLSKVDLFAQMLLDLAECLAPRLTIMDAVIGMEGDGPGNGDPRQVGLLLGSADPLAIDVVMGEIIGLDQAANPLLVEAEKQGRGPTRIEEVELIGLDPGDLRVPDFRLPSTHSPMAGLASASWWQNLLYPLFTDALTLQPVVNGEDCIACQDCVNICPEGVISTVENSSGRPQAWIDDEGCIRCYCCHETCPEDAIELKKSLLYRVVMG
jgi:uncharacterized protein (DUF362 family)/Pyruvate/2-oxoacid:ferredoxin oxidoreductase delta subunit